MLTQILNPYEATIKRYPYGQPVLFICDSTDASFEVILPDAYAIKDTLALYFQKNNSGNTVYIKTQFGQSINGVERISLVWQYHSIMVVSDNTNYRVLSGVVPELPSTFPLGRYWRLRPVDYDLNIEKDIGMGTGNWQPYDEMKMV